MDTRPALYLAHPSHKAGHGPGARYTIMRSAPKGTGGMGVVSLLWPPAGALRGFHTGTLTEAEFQRLLQAQWNDPTRLAPGRLWVSADRILPVMSGDTLTCTCAIGAFCHRRVAAPILEVAGWAVWLDGVRLSPSGVTP